MRVGLVLGGGGVVGLAYHEASLAAIEHDLGWDPRSADVIVGTSAGALIGALLPRGVPASDLAALRRLAGPSRTIGRRVTGSGSWHDSRGGDGLAHVADADVDGLIPDQAASAWAKDGPQHRTLTAISGHRDRLNAT